MVNAKQDQTEEPGAQAEEIDAKEDDESQEEVSELPPTSPQDDSGMIIPLAGDICNVWNGCAVIPLHYK